jgi:predicted nucleic acid-binding protein
LQAVAFDRRLGKCREIWTTDAVLLEIGAAFRRPPDRNIPAIIWHQFQSDPIFHLASVSGSLLERGMELFRQRPDKIWSLTDCLSFVVMEEHKLSDVLTCDHHFVQAGFRALLLEKWNAEPPIQSH